MMSPGKRLPTCGKQAGARPTYLLPSVSRKGCPLHLQGGPMSAAPLVTQRVLACLSLRAGGGLPFVCFLNRLFPPHAAELLENRSQ